MIGIPVGIVASHFNEWWIHKYLLHGLGKRRDSVWSFHWSDHHQACRKNGNYDPMYLAPLNEWNPRTREIAAMAVGAAIYLPLTPIAPFFVGTMVYQGLRYYRMHKRAHLEVEWGKEHMPWHYDHHMAPNQDANWGVTQCWVDKLLGTREPWLGTPEEAAHHAKQAARAAKGREKAQRKAEPATAAPAPTGGEKKAGSRRRAAPNQAGAAA